jgi:hypothetical protein
MIALSCKSIVMGKQSSLGPIDPHIGEISAIGALEEIRQACDEIRVDPSRIPLWQARLANYPVAFEGECRRAIQWSIEMVGSWLTNGMFSEEHSRDPEGTNDRITRIWNEFGKPALTKTHRRHISMEKCKEKGLKIEAMDDNPKLQDAVLRLHEETIQTMSENRLGKIVENHNGKFHIERIAKQ